MAIIVFQEGWWPFHNSTEVEIYEEDNHSSTRKLTLTPIQVIHKSKQYNSTEIDSLSTINLEPATETSLESKTSKD